MKDIKFRAYDTVKKEWLDQDELIFTHGLWFKNFRSLEDYVPLDVDSGKVRISQYTGLKDKNKKEIYECDIVLVKDTIPPFLKDFFGEVKYLDCNYIVDNRKEAIYLFDEFNEIEIIGNILENPELLNDEK